MRLNRITVTWTNFKGQFDSSFDALVEIGRRITLDLTKAVSVVVTDPRAAI